jgi:prepilin-type N-terminal cleavage/methylation domain-containing protein
VRRTGSAFTLIELLTVIAIIGVLAALTAPVVGHFRKGDAMAAATRQMLDAVHRGRQLAISQHTTVYMVFSPPTLWSDPLYGNLSLTASERAAALSALEKEQTGYAFVSLRSVGDQPGRRTTRYLSAWETLPDSTFIPQWKFPQPSTPTSMQIKDPSGTVLFTVLDFDTTQSIPFPSEDAAYTLGLTRPPLPYIAFDYLGRLVDANGLPLNRDEFIPLAHGSVSPARNPVTRVPIFGVGAAPDERELPPGNSTNSSYNVVHIDWLTGRARLERQEVK